MPVSFEWNKIFIVLSLAIILFIAGNRIDANHKLLIAVFRIFLLIIFPFVLIRLKLFEEIEIIRVKEGLLKLRGKILHY